MNFDDLPPANPSATPAGGGLDFSDLPDTTPTPGPSPTSGPGITPATTAAATQSGAALDQVTKPIYSPEDISRYGEIRPQTYRERMLGDFRSILQTKPMGGTLVPRPEPLVPPQISQRMASVPGFFMGTIGGPPGYNEMRHGFQESLGNQISELSRPDALLTMAGQAAIPQLTVPSFVGERLLSLPDQYHRVAEHYRKGQYKEAGQALGEELPADLLALFGIKTMGAFRRYGPSPYATRQAPEIIPPRGQVPTPQGWMHGNAGDLAGVPTGFTMPGYNPPPLNLPSPPITPRSLLRSITQKFAPTEDYVGPVMPQTKEKTNAIKPSITQVPPGGTAQRKQEGTTGAEPTAGDSDHAFGETEGTAAGGNVPPAEPVTPGQAVVPEVPKAKPKTIKQMDLQELQDKAEKEYNSKGKFVPRDLAEEISARLQGKPPEPLKQQLPPEQQPLSELLSRKELKEHDDLVDQYAALSSESVKYLNDQNNPRAWQIAEEQGEIQRKLRKLTSHLPGADMYDIGSVGSGAAGLAVARHGATESGPGLLRTIIFEHEGGHGTASGKTGRYTNVGGGKGPLGSTGATRELIDRQQAIRQGAEFRDISDITDYQQDPETGVWTIKTKGHGEGGEGGETFKVRNLIFATGTRPRVAPFEMRGPDGKVIPKENTQLGIKGQQVHIDNADGMRAEAGANGDMAAAGAANSSFQAMVTKLADPKYTGVFHIFSRRPELTGVSAELKPEARLFKKQGRLVIHPNQEVQYVEVPSKANGNNYMVYARDLKTGKMLPPVPVKSVGSFIGGVPSTGNLPKNFLFGKGSRELQIPPGLIRTTEDLRPLTLDAQGNEVPVKNAFAAGTIRDAPGINRMDAAAGEGARAVALASMDMAKQPKPQWKIDLQNAFDRLDYLTGESPPATKPVRSTVKEVIGLPGTPILSGGKVKVPMRLPPEPAPVQEQPISSLKKEAAPLKKEFPPPPPPAPPAPPQQQQPPEGGRPPIPPLVVPYRSEIPNKPEFPPVPREEPVPPPVPDQYKVQKPEEIMADMAEASQRLQDNPNRPDQLVSGLAFGSDRVLDGADETLLVKHKEDLQKSRNLAGQRAMNSSLPAGERAAAGDQFQDLDAQIRFMDMATQDGKVIKGQNQARFWNQFRLRDYEFPTMEQKISIARAGKPLTPAEKTSLKRETDRLVTAMATAEGIRVRSGYVPGLKEAPIEFRKAEYQVKKAKDALDDDVFREIYRNKNLLSKATHIGHEVVSLQRAWMTSLDFSAVLRQGGPIFAAHPIRALKDMPDMFKAAGSDFQYFRLMQDIRDRPNSQLYIQSKLGLTDLKNPNFSQMEEAYMSRWADAIPLINHSQRAYVYYLNRLRADSFDAMAKELTTNGVPTPDQAAAIANFVNVFTGRGRFKEDYANASAILNDLFFAPRFTLSRFQMLSFQPYRFAAARDAAVRELIAKEYARTMMGYGTVYALAKFALPDFVDVGDDPTSADFGKIIIKGTNQHIDIMSGLSQVTVFAAREGELAAEQIGYQLQTGQPKRRPLTKRGPFAVAADFGRTKAAPLPSAVINSAEGKKVTGEPATVGSEIWDLVTPMTPNDIQKSLRDAGVPAGAAAGLLTMFGASVQTYAPRAPVKGRSRKRSRHR